MKTTTLLITGAGGTVGQLLIQHYLQDPNVRIKALERSEMAMAELVALYHTNPQVEPILADLLHPHSYTQLLKGSSAVIHCAALKHVVIGRHFPERQAYENITAFCHLLRAARDAGVQKFLFCSTDKAAQPTGVMGASKHLLEFICRDAASPSFATGAVRFANIIGSNGSLLNVMQNRIADGGDIILRDERMTRYFLRPQDAVELIAYALDNMQNGEIFTRDTPAARIKDVMEVVLEKHNLSTNLIKVAEEPTFENLYERLLAPEEVPAAHKWAAPYLVIGGTRGKKLSANEQERALSSSALTIDKPSIQQLLYA